MSLARTAPINPVLQAEAPDKALLDGHTAALHLFRLDGRTIAITGACGSLGCSFIKALLEYGADIAAIDILPEPTTDEWGHLRQTAVKEGRQIRYFRADVTDQDRVQSAFDEIDRDCRYQLRGLVSCAGVSGRCPAIDYPLDAFRHVLDINVTGSFLCARTAARLMHQRGVSGSIVLIASMSGHHVNQVRIHVPRNVLERQILSILEGVSTVAYNSSKSAVLQMGRSLAAEWGNDPSHEPIRVNTLSPGYIETALTIPTLDMMPGLRELWTQGNMLGRLARTHEFRAPLLFLLGDGSSYMTGADLRVDAGHCSW